MNTKQEEQQNPNPKYTYCDGGYCPLKLNCKRFDPQKKGVVRFETTPFEADTEECMWQDKK